MPYLSVNENGIEKITPGKPMRGRHGDWDYCEDISIEGEEGTIYIEIELPKGSIYKLTGKVLTWKDEPIEYK